MRVLFVCSGLSLQSISPVVAAQGLSLERAGISLDYFPIGGRGAVAYLRAVIRLRKLLSGKRYDCVHAHYGLCGIISLLAVRKSRLVVSFMGDDILGSRNSYGRITPGSRLLARLNTALSARFYDHTIVKSERMLKPAMKMQSVSVIPNGVNTDLFRPFSRSEALGETGWNPGSRHIVFVSDPLRSEKNFRLAQKAVEHLNRKDVELHAVKGVDPVLMPAIYNSADALLLTSFHEGSANAIKEAMACNCPVISTDTGDAAWVTGNTEGCFIVPLEHQAVARSVERAVEFRLSRGLTEGRGRIMNLGLDSASVAGKIIGIYQKIRG